MGVHYELVLISPLRVYSEIGWAIGLKYTEGFTFVAKHLYSGVDGVCVATGTRG